LRNFKRLLNGPSLGDGIRGDEITSDSRVARFEPVGYRRELQREVENTTQECHEPLTALNNTIQLNNIK